MDANEKQIALSVLESLREDLTYVCPNNGSRVFDVADLRQYIYALTGSPCRMKTNAVVMDGLHGNDNGHRQDISKNGHNGNARPTGKNLARTSNKPFLR